MVLFVGNPLGKDPPEDAKDQADQNLNGSVKGQLPNRRAGIEGKTEEDSEAGDGDDVVGRASCNDKGGDALSNSIPSLGKGHQAGYDYGWRDSCQNKSQHEADGPGKTKNKVAEDGNHDSLNEARDEGGPDHHCRELHEGNRVKFKAGHEENNSKADRSESSADGGVEVVADILWVTVINILCVCLCLSMTTSTSAPCYPRLVLAAPGILQQLLLHFPRLPRHFPFLLQLFLLCYPPLNQRV